MVDLSNESLKIILKLMKFGILGIDLSSIVHILKGHILLFLQNLICFVC